ncbi:CBS domain-containing protein [Neolewinella aurantiaca]|uniref:CBS domain-containing protein n=2 Tax=Neolewinella aurantiaca TaxID=2602767 RepID=A0A5C7G097_9BACT|nr:CBS domain-containing protein [Neolewinella aurantiaca]
MTTDVVTVSEHTPVAVALGLFKKHNIHHLPVLSPEKALIGIVSPADFLKLPDNGAGMHLVKEIMTSHVAKLEPTDTVRTAANLFCMNKFHALPVIEDGKLAGILTTLDLVRLIDQEEIRLEDYA